MNRKGLFATVVSILFLGFAFSQAAAGTAGLDKIVTRIQDNYKSMKDYEATFVQETKIKVVYIIQNLHFPT